MTSVSLLESPFVDWLRAQIDRRCTRVALRERALEREELVREWDLGPSVDAARMAEEIEERIRAEAGQHEGTVLYGLFAFRAGESLHVDRKLCRVELDGGRGRDAVLARALLDQSELAMRLVLAQSDAIFRHYKTLLAQRDTELTETRALLRAACTGRRAPPRRAHRGGSTSTRH